MCPTQYYHNLFYTQATDLCCSKPTSLEIDFFKCQFCLCGYLAVLFIHLTDSSAHNTHTVAMQTYFRLLPLFSLVIGNSSSIDYGSSPYLFFSIFSLATWPVLWYVFPKSIFLRQVRRMVLWKGYRCGLNVYVHVDISPVGFVFLEKPD